MVLSLFSIVLPLLTFVVRQSRRQNIRHSTTRQFFDAMRITKIFQFFVLDENTMTPIYIMVLYVAAATVSAYTSQIHLISRTSIARHGSISRRFQGSLKRAAKGT